MISYAVASNSNRAPNASPLSANVFDTSQSMLVSVLKPVLSNPPQCK